MGTVGSDASKNVVNIIWLVANNLSFADTSLSLREVVSAVIKATINTEEHLFVVNILGEVDIVDLVDVSLVHISSEEHLHLVLRGCDLEQVKHS